MNAEDIKISVIIPVYNAEKYIGQCLESVLSQSLKEIEVICVDDASTDHSLKNIEMYMKRDSRLRVYKNVKNLYAGACRNKGLKIAKGEYVHFLDADDLVEENAYEAYYYAAKKAVADFVKGPSRRFNNDTLEVSTTPLLSFSKITEEKYNKVFTFADDPEIFSHMAVVPWNGIYRRRFLLERNIEFNDLLCVNDRSFFNEISLAANRIVLIRDFFVRYRVNNQESLIGRRAKHFDCQFKSYNIIEKQCQFYHLNEQQTKCVLERELMDLFMWYRKYCNLPEIGMQIEQSTREFLMQLDIDFLKKGNVNFGWYFDYLSVIYKTILTVVVYMEGDVSSIQKCLESIQYQNIKKMAVYGIANKKKNVSIFSEYMMRDERFKGIIDNTEEISEESPYFFEVYPQNFKSKKYFREQIVEMVQENDMLQEKRKVFYAKTTVSLTFKQRLLRKIKKWKNSLRVVRD